MDRNELAAAWGALQALPFPPHPQDPDLADWLMDLLEVDGFYAGLAVTTIEGGMSAKPRRDELKELGEWLQQIRVASPEDEVTLGQCRIYFAALSRLHNAMLA